jgi:diguanylate cyclase (GGDEF)-like protein/PAS domain S-box-containing protein
LQSLNASLEQKVETRTAELRREMEVRRESEQQFRQLSDRLSEAQHIGKLGFIDWDLNTNEIEVSDETLRIYGLDPGKNKLKLEEIVKLVHPDDAEYAEKSLYDAIEKGSKHDIEHRIVRSNGTVGYVHTPAEVLRDANGKPIRVLGTVQDITERKQAELMLLQHKVAIDTTHDGFLITDGQGILLDTNQAYANMSGYSLDELRGMHISQFEAKEQSLDEIKAHVTKIISQGWDVFETRHRHKDGHEIELEVSASFIPESKQIVTFLRDITERKQAEVNLRIAATAFESHESMMITDADTVILRVNQAFTEITGYTSEEAVGQTPRLLKSGRHNADFYRAMWETLQRTGAWQGEIWNRRKNGEVYPEWLTISAVKAGNGVVTHYVGSYLDMTEHKAAEESIKNLAFYDPLTGLPNRRLLMDRLQHTLASSARSGREGALLFIDLDNFKDINDTLGHDIGDLLLQQTAQRLESCLRESDTVARLGGDEFVVVLEDLSEHALEAATQTKTVGEKILATLGQPYRLATHEYHSTSSIGATIFSDHGQSGEELLKRADIAMYQAKKAGRNTLRFFDPQMQVSITARVSLESELRKALGNQQFQLHYQIQVDSSHRPLGAEALIRWIHPLRGMVSPAQFIPLAEETGLMLPIGQWVLETACTQLKAWEQDAVTRDLILAVNVSAKQFHQADFVAQVQAAVQHHAINPMLLKLELTEGMLLENIEDTIATMNALKEIGVQFSLDDFGTGYSSLQYLKRLPLDQLKIDQSFVRDIAIDNSDKAIVSTIIAMAQSLDMDVIAEGVETEEQRQFLMERGCTHYQGYLFSKPVPIEQFEALLKHG